MERRYDGSDGPYTYQEFAQFYGPQASARWQQATPAQAYPGAPPAQAWPGAPPMQPNPGMPMQPYLQPGYGATGYSSAPHQQFMDQLAPSVVQKRKLNAADLFGLEGKNTYELYNGPSEQNAEMLTRMGEKSECCERCCFGAGREATWESRLYNKTGPVLWKLEKERHWPCCACCSRPRATVTDAHGQKLGSIEDPCTCCSYNQDLFDAAGRHVYHLEGTSCQVGLCWPCCADAEFTLTRPGAGPMTVGKVARLQANLTECCCPTMRYRLDFPKGATADEKALLLGAQVMLDTVYLAGQADTADEGQELAENAALGAAGLAGGALLSFLGGS